MVYTFSFTSPCHSASNADLTPRSQLVQNRLRDVRCTGESDSAVSSGLRMTLWCQWHRTVRLQGVILSNHNSVMSVALISQTPRVNESSMTPWMSVALISQTPRVNESSIDFLVSVAPFSPTSRCVLSSKWGHIFVNSLLFVQILYVLIAD